MGSAALQGGRGTAGRTSGSASAAGLLSALRALDSDPRVLEATQAVRQAATELRWAQVLRRRWREARAEATVRSAVASGAVEGAVVSAAWLRERVACGGLDRASTGDPSQDAVAALWRAGARVSEMMPDLNGPGKGRVAPARELLAGLHRDLAVPLLLRGQISQDQLGAPRRDGQASLEGGPGQAPEGARLQARLEGLTELIDVAGAPALVRAALVHGELVSARPFVAGNAALGRLLVRHLLVRDALEPTGTAVSDYYPAQAPQAYKEAAGAYATGAPEGVVAWIVWQAQALLAGIQQAHVLLRSVQAGSTVP